MTNLRQIPTTIFIIAMTTQAPFDKLQAVKKQNS